MPLCSRSGCRVLRVREAHVRDVKDATLGIQGSGQLYLLSFEECRQLLIIELIEGPVGVVFEYQLLARPGYSALKCPLLLRGLRRCLLLFSHTRLLRAFSSMGPEFRRIPLRVLRRWKRKPSGLNTVFSALLTYKHIVCVMQKLDMWDPRLGEAASP